MSEKKKPVVRFAGFTDDWEQRKLGEIATFINGRAYSQDELLDSGKYKVLRVGNFYTNDAWYYSDLELGEKYYANYGDLLYTWSATFGPHIWLGDRVIYHYHIWKVELSDALDKQFMVQLLEQDKANIISTHNGSTMVHVTKFDMEQKMISIPSVPEQKKIGGYLTALDHLITLHQRKCDKLKNVKKSMLEKMFPKNGRRVPEIRFAGFTDDWELRKISEIVSLLKDGSHGTHIDVEDGPYLLSAKNIKNGSLEINSEVERRISWDDYKHIHSNFMLQKNDILMTIVGTIGECTKLENPENITFQRSVAFLRPNEEVDADFMVAEIQTKDFQTELDSRKLVSAQPGIYLGKLAEMCFCHPKKEEQRKIGEYFRSLDNLITLHQRELEKLQNIKKSCLEKMFV